MGELLNHFELRLFPNKFQGDSKYTRVIGFEIMRVALKNEMKEVFKELSSEQNKRKKGKKKAYFPLVNKKG